MNGLLRQYLPNRTDLSVLHPTSLARIEDRLYSGPRKRLGWASSTEAFTAALAGF